MAFGTFVIAFTNAAIVSQSGGYGTWTDPSKALVQDDDPATAPWGSGPTPSYPPTPTTYTDWLVLTGPVHSLPAGFTPSTVQCRIRYRCQSNRVQYGFIGSLVRSGNIAYLTDSYAGQNQYFQIAQSGSATWFTTGTTGTLNPALLTPALSASEFDDPTFGVAVQLIQGDAVTFELDYMFVEVSGTYPEGCALTGGAFGRIPDTNVRRI